MENFHDLIIQRRSIRRYTDQPIDPEHVKTILEAALLAPTSKSTRAWEFVVVEDKDMLQRLSECRPAGSQPIAAASLAVVVCVDSTKSEPWIEDASIAAAYMQLQVADLGLGSCWIQVRGRFTPGDQPFPSEEYIQEALGIPETVNVECVITIGHKNEERRPQNTEKLLWNQIHLGKW